MQRIASMMRAMATIGTNLTRRSPALASAAFPDNRNSQNLLPTSLPLLNQVCGFKLKGIVRRRCKSCYFVVRDGRMHVICPEHPRHKQKAMRPKPHNTWILTHASQSKVRPW